MPSHLQLCKVHFSVSPGNWGGILKAWKGLLWVGWCSGGEPNWRQKHLMAQCKVMRAREAAGMPHKGPKATCWALSSAFQPDNTQERLSLSKAPPLPAQQSSFPLLPPDYTGVQGPQRHVSSNIQSAAMSKAPELPKGSKQIPTNHLDATNTEWQVPLHRGLYSSWTLMKIM